MTTKLVGMCGGEGATSYRIVEQHEESVIHYPMLNKPLPQDTSLPCNGAVSILGYIDSTMSRTQEKVDAALRMCIYTQSNETRKRLAIVLSVEGNTLKCSNDLATMFDYHIVDVQGSKVTILPKSPQVHYLGKAE